VQAPIVERKWERHGLLAVDTHFPSSRAGGTRSTTRILVSREQALLLRFPSAGSLVDCSLFLFMYFPDLDLRHHFNTITSDSLFYRKHLFRN